VNGDTTTFDVGLIIMLKGQEEPTSAMVQMRAPVNPELNLADYIVDATAAFLWDQYDSASRPWYELNDSGGNATLLFKDQVQSIRIMAPKIEEDR
jgi:hypothetical protein